MQIICRRRVGTKRRFRNLRGSKCVGFKAGCFASNNSRQQCTCMLAFFCFHFRIYRRVTWGRDVVYRLPSCRSRRLIVRVLQRTCVRRQRCSQHCKLWPLRRRFCPALQCDLVHRIHCTHRLRQPVPVRNLLHHLCILHPLVRLRAVPEALVHQDPKRPHVRRRREPKRLDRFGRRPPNREHAVRASVVLARGIVKEGKACFSFFHR